ncbi:hypothetical protein KIKIMORA_04170 [Brevundimonas phage vB_BpoS-Kikimora]|uniref:Uncharacterized protein n=2 Tax=Kikimoravirus TaxID=3425051 RepID=A0A9E7N4M4_9CAUD|nr:hypothetical protein KIKIMORA_04170 [Brevundimonas phage vB_BpoS-Kikimora]UTC28422.1 hypothetical protein GURKE_04200 [Brevundimonas phage vB_BpoS-Gurke]
MMTLTKLFAPIVPAYLAPRRYESLRSALMNTSAITTISTAPR